MSIQESKLAAIADAIREAEGSNADIPAEEFPPRIRALKGNTGNGEIGGFSVLIDRHPNTVIYTGALICAGISSINCNVSYEIIEED